MNYVVGIILGFIGLYVLVNIGLFLYLLPMAIDERKIQKALSLIMSYNRWALDNGKEDLVIPPLSNINFEFRPSRAIFCSFWAYYEDIEVINSLRAYAKSYRYVRHNGRKEWRESK